MPPPAKRVTLKTISIETGLAVATVSRALKGDPAIKNTTRETVLKAAEALDYVRDTAAVQLRTGRSYTIAAVFPIGFELSNHSARLMNAVANALRKTPYTLSIMPFHNDEDPLIRIKEIVRTRSADGIIINGITPEDERVKYMLDNNFPFVTHGRSSWVDKHDYFDYDNRAYAHWAVTKLAERGRRKIAMIAPPQDQSYGIEMVQGATDAARQIGVDFHALQDVTSDSAPQDIYSAVRALLAQKLPIDAFITPSAPAGMAVLGALEDVGLSLGEDIDLSVKETPVVVSWFRTAVLSQSEDTRIAGEFLTEALLARIESPDAPLRQRLDGPK